MFNYVLTAFIAFFRLHCLAKQLVGPYDIIFHKLSQCNGMPVNEDNLKYGVKFVRFNKTTVQYSSNITLPKGFTNNMKVVAEYSVLRNGAWKNNYINFRLDKGCSDFIKLFPGYGPSLMKAAGTTFTGCPIKSGTYEVKDWVIDLNVASGIFPYNSYKVTVSVIDSKRKIMCIIVELDVVPKSVN